ncbi:MAG: MATE family efflux transporter [Planctomycetes bacterium]|nr:MATE family efflux transporter [Planctomycetota bacterium]
MSAEPHPLRPELRAQLRLAGPMVLVQLGLYAMGAVDAAFMGRVSALEFGAVALGHSLSFAVLGIAMGTLTALDPIVSQAHGAGEDEAVARALQRGVVLALVLSAVVGALLLFIEPLLRALHQPEAVIPLAARFVHISILGVPGFLLFVAQRQTLQATHRLRALVFVILFANGLNAFLDWMLIRGHLGAPALGSAGCAWATVIARWTLALALPLLAGEVHFARLWPLRRGLWSASAFARMLHVGVPIGLSFGLEIGAFSCVAVFMGQLGARELAANQVVMSLVSASFMIPLALSMAASVRVGNAIGRGEPAAAKRAAQAALTLGASVMLLSAAAFTLAPMTLARIFTDIQGVLVVAVTLLPIAALFQVFDGVQGVAMGCLRGMADTRVPLLVHVVGFWGVAIPVSAWLGLRLGWGARGLWWGLALGLAVVALVQVARVRARFRAGVTRFAAEGH